MDLPIECLEPQK